ncbi:hypothetical protein TNCV_234301 [Trichonephila clavipes]|uniref:Uncharacterized protein n=1 Tax=Trichonephila clavipes TaxID=2585209 RepID=A0A8X6SP28_TRICX|nr:hypothetical protein TNCV_234301 [Trichonephila clavipes]
MAQMMMSRVDDTGTGHVDSLWQQTRNVLPSSVQFLGRQFGNRLLLTVEMKTYDDLVGFLGALLFKLATFASEMHALDDRPKASLVRPVVKVSD